MEDAAAVVGEGQVGFGGEGNAAALTPPGPDIAAGRPARNGSRSVAHMFTV